MDFSDLLIQKVAQVGALGAIQEINLRLFADKTANLKSLAHAQRLEQLEDAFFAEYDEYINPEEKTSIAAGRVIRNKILHANFEAASAKAAAIEAGIHDSSVRKMDLATRKVEKAQDLSIQEAGIYGWLLVCSDNGFLGAAEKIFKRNIATIIRVDKDVQLGTNSKPR